MMLILEMLVWLFLVCMVVLVWLLLYISEFYHNIHSLSLVCPVLVFL